jgi:curli biogenesis system outer membrane secretion channel CsgG
MVSIGLTIVIISGCGPQIQTTVDTGGPTVQESITYEGPKARIGVPRFDCKAEKCGGDIGYGLSDMVSTALFKSGRFVVLERGEGLSEVQRELELSESGYVDKSKAPRMGMMEGADVLVMGGITAFEPKASGTRAGGVVVPFNVPLLGGVAVKKNEAYIAADIRLVDVRTGRIINATTVEGLASRYKVGGIGGFVAGTVALGAGFSTYKNTPMEKAVRVMLDNAISEISKLVPQDYYRYDNRGQEISSYQPAYPSTPMKQDLRAKATSPPPAIISGSRFSPGRETVFSEDFSSYDIGDIPKTLTVKSGQIEVAEFSNSKWLRCLSDVRMIKTVDLSRDFSIEYTVYKPQGSPSMNFYIGSNTDSPEKLSWREDVTWKGTPLTSYRVETGQTHSFAIEKKNGNLKIFVDDKLLINEPALVEAGGAKSRDGFLFETENVNVSRGDELLITNVKIGYY